MGRSFFVVAKHRLGYTQSIAQLEEPALREDVTVLMIRWAIAHDDGDKEQVQELSEKIVEVSKNHILLKEKAKRFVDSLSSEES